MQLKVETYNTFNHTEFTGLNSTATFANATQGLAQTSADPQTGATFGQLTSTGNTGSWGGPRVMQLALRVDF